MSFRKSDRILRELREQILSGSRPRGAKLPTYDELMEQYAVTRPTVARALTTLRSQGLVTVQGTRGVFVAENFPHRSRYLWVTSEYPGHPEWTTFLATFLDLIERAETGLPGEVIPLIGVDGRANNPAYQKLCEAIREEAVAGLFVMNSATTYLLPILEQANLPRAAVWAPLPHSGLVSLAFETLIQRACRSLLQGGRKPLILSPHAPVLKTATDYLGELGFPNAAAAGMHVTPVGCESLVRLLLDRPERPDAIFVTDDNLVEPLLRGFEAAKVRPKRDVYVLAHCNWPRPVGAEAGVDHIGFDVREIFLAGKEVIDAQRDGLASPKRTIEPRFASELFDTIEAEV